MAKQAAADRLPGSNMEGSEERGSTVALVVMRWELRQTGPPRQNGAVRLNLTLIERQHQGPIRWIDIQATTSRTFSSHCGPLDSWEPLDPLRWHVVSRHTPCSRVQVTARGRASHAPPMRRSGALVVVSSIFCSTSAVHTRREHFHFGRRRIASSPSRHNAARVAITVGRDRPFCWAMALWATPRGVNRNDHVLARRSLRRSAGPSQRFQRFCCPG